MMPQASNSGMSSRIQGAEMVCYHPKHFRIGPWGATLVTGCITYLAAALQCAQLGVQQGALVPTVQDRQASDT